MVDVEDMIGELEDENETDEEADTEAGDTGEDPEEETFGLDLDSAWGSPDREADD